MKKSILLFLLFFASQYAFSLDWHTNFKQAQKDAILQNKLMVVVFTGQRFTPCKEMEIGVWIDQDVLSVLENYIPVKIDTNENKRLANDYQIIGIPQILIMDANGKTIARFMGANDKEYILLLLESYLFNLDYVKNEIENFYNYKNYGSALRLYVKYLDYSLYAEDYLKNDLIGASEQYFSEAQLKLNKKDVDFKVKNQKLELLKLYNCAYNNDFINLKEKLNVFRDEIILENQDIYYFLKYITSKHFNDNDLEIIIQKIAAIEGFDSMIKKADFILSKKN